MSASTESIASPADLKQISEPALIDRIIQIRQIIDWMEIVSSEHPALIDQVDQEAWVEFLADLYVTEADLAKQRAKHQKKSKIPTENVK